MLLYPYCLKNTVPAGFVGTKNTRAPVAYSGIEPDTTNCFVNHGGFLECSIGAVLSDGDIGPTYSVDVRDPDQVCRFFVWHRDNGTVMLLFLIDGISRFDVSYIDIYTLSVPSARIGSPGTTSFRILEGTVSSLNTQSCSFSSSASTLSRTAFNMSLTYINALLIRFEFPSQDIDWLFISEIQLCEGNVPSSISCDPPTPTTDPQQQNGAASTGCSLISGSAPQSASTGQTPAYISSVIPDLHQPDSVSLTCSIPVNSCYSVQWQWWRRGGTTEQHSICYHEQL